MATVMSSPASSPPELDASISRPNIPTLPPIVTTSSARRTNIQRPPSYARNRMSTYSSTSFGSQNRSRPVSHVFPIFHSSLPYALVRDFAYPAIHPLHYGPPPSDSGISTPATDPRRLSDPSLPSWDGSKGYWPAESWNPETMHSHQQLPAMAFGDGPPYSEDEDLQSPVVTASRQRKQKSGHAGLGSDSRRGRSPGAANPSDSSRMGYSTQSGDRGVFVGVNGDGSETYYVKGDDSVEDGPGGEFVTYPASESRRSHLEPGSFSHDAQRDSHFAASLRDRRAVEPSRDLESDDEISEDDSFRDPSRYSRDYQFTIVSPDEEMHGKAVALFDFTREHENELPLTEGQVILVSYRHGQGWLVAEDPRTGESGLVPEDFVRLLRDIEGGLTGLNGELMNNPSAADRSSNPLAPDLAFTPSETDHEPDALTSDYSAQVAPLTNGSSNTDSNTTNNNPSLNPNVADNKDKAKDKEKDKHPPVLSTFSTSSRDLDPYPQHLLGGKSTPPPIEHYDGTPGGNGSTTPLKSRNISKQAARG